MTPMLVQLNFSIPDPITEDLEMLESEIREFIEEKIGEVDYTIADYGLCFELHDD